MNFRLLLVLGVITAMAVLVMGVEHPHDDPNVPCSYQSKRKMLKESCEHFRRRRSSHTRGEQDVHSGGLQQISIVANDTSGALLIRNKRGQLYYCCVPNQKNCRRIRVCLE